MIVEFSVVDTKDFTIEHLFDSPENQDLIANFQATNDAAGLEIISRSSPWKTKRTIVAEPTLSRTPCRENWSLIFL